MQFITLARNPVFQLVLTGFYRYKESMNPRNYSPTFLADKVNQIMYH